MNIRVVYKELIRQAAQADVIHHDDTAMKILELMKKEGVRANRPEKGSSQAVFCPGTVKEESPCSLPGENMPGKT